MFLVLSTAQVIANKITNRRLQIFCEKRGQLEKKRRERHNRLGQGTGSGHQIFRCVHRSFSDTNSSLIGFYSNRDSVLSLPQITPSRHPSTHGPQQEHRASSPRIRVPIESQSSPLDYHSAGGVQQWPGRQNPISYTNNSTGYDPRYHQPPRSPLRPHDGNIPTAHSSQHYRRDDYPSPRGRSQSPPHLQKSLSVSHQLYRDHR